MCLHPCALMNRWADTHAHTQMFILNQIQTYTYTHVFLSTESTSGCSDFEKKKHNFPSSFQSGCDSDWPFSCGQSETMSAWVAINLRATFTKKHSSSASTTCLSNRGHRMDFYRKHKSCLLHHFLFKSKQQMMQRGHRVLCVLRAYQWADSPPCTQCNLPQLK